MSLQTIHITQGDHNAALVACQHPAATEDDKAFLGYVASLYVICERISRDDYHRLQAILRRLDGAQADAPQPTTTPAPVEAGATLNLPAFFHQHPDTTYLLCQLWGKANERDTESDWYYVAGWIDGLGNMLADGDIVETGAELTFLHGLALRRGLMADAFQWEATP